MNKLSALASVTIYTQIASRTEANDYERPSKRFIHDFASRSTDSHIPERLKPVPEEAFALLSSGGAIMTG